jgi:hypothetical protein
MDRGGFCHRVGQAAAAGFDSCDAGGGDEGTFGFFEVRFGGVEQEEVGFDVVEEASLRVLLVFRHVMRFSLID